MYFRLFAARPDANTNDFLNLFTFTFSLLFRPCSMEINNWIQRLSSKNPPHLVRLGPVRSTILRSCIFRSLHAHCMHTVCRIRRKSVHARRNTSLEQHQGQTVGDGLVRQRGRTRSVRGSPSSPPCLPHHSTELTHPSSCLQGGAHCRLDTTVASVSDVRPSVRPCDKLLCEDDAEQPVITSASGTRRRSSCHFHYTPPPPAAAAMTFSFSGPRRKLPTRRQTDRHAHTDGQTHDDGI